MKFLIKEDGSLFRSCYKCINDFQSDFFAVKFTLSPSSDLTYTEGSNGPYKTLELEFHWGKVDIFDTNNYTIEGGSEHTFNSMHFPLEVGFFIKNIVLSGFVEIFLKKNI